MHFKFSFLEKNVVSIKYIPSEGSLTKITK